jgi:RNA polymerase sigma-70 factor (ECF subfamily)
MSGLGRPGGTDVREAVDRVYREESRRILATLIRLVGDFELAEEGMLDAFTSALEQWPKDGVPANPRAWLISAGRFKAIDAIRRKNRFDSSVAALGEALEEPVGIDLDLDDATVRDDTLRLIFTCCHPALPPDARTALTLREVCGLTTEEVARAFLISSSTVAQRIVRAKSKIRDAKIPYKVPSPEDLPERLGTLLQVVYLLFNEGYSASFGDALTRPDLSGEAIRLGRLVLELMPEPEVMGLLALMLLQESRRAARSSASGDLVLLEDQDRSLWNREYIVEGRALVQRALSLPGFGRYSIQAAIAAVHSEASSSEDTDWRQIVGLYDALLLLTPSPVVELNRAVAVAMRDGPGAGLAIVEAILERGDLADYHLAYSVRAELCRRVGRIEEAKAYFERALSLTKQGPEQRFLAGRLEALSGA